MAVKRAITGEGRDARGRFVVGNPGGPGRPRGYNEAILEACTPEDLSKIVAVLVAKAIGGDVRAAEVLLRRMAPERVAIEHSGPDGGATTIRILEFPDDGKRKRSS